MTMDQIADKHLAELKKLGRRGEIIQDLIALTANYFAEYKITKTETRIYCKMLLEASEAT
jgi:hypothetical protein